MFATEIDRKIYAEELSPRLPEKILDSHVHIWSKKDFPAGFSFPAKDCCNRFGGEFTIPQWREIMAELLPEQQVFLNCFGTPHAAADRTQLPAGAGENDFVNLLISPDDPAEKVEELLDAGGAVGVKPYLNYAAQVFGKKDNDVEIFDMLSKEQLAMLNRKKMAVTLHIPRSARFADPVNQKQMIELCETYPDIRIIFAHIGRAYYMRNIRESNIDDFVRFPNVYFDTAMLNHEGILNYTFDHFPAERILFGSDSPIALLRGKSVEINNQYAYLMAEDYEIGTVIKDTCNMVKFTTFFYEELRAVINTAPAGQLENVFYNNANKLFRSIKAK